MKRVTEVLEVHGGGVVMLRDEDRGDENSQGVVMCYEVVVGDDRMIMSRLKVGGETNVIIV